MTGRAIDPIGHSVPIDPSVPIDHSVRAAPPGPTLGAASAADAAGAGRQASAPSSTSSSPVAGARLRAESPEMVRELQPGSMVSIGRAGSIPVGSRNDRVPAIAAVLECEETNWTVRIPVETKLWIDVMVGDVRLWAGTGGQMCARSEPDAELRIRTTTQHHRVRITFSTEARFSIRPSGETVSADLVLTPQNPNHRAWIVACANRLRYWNAPSLLAAEIAERLGCSQTNATTRLTRAKDEIQVWAEASTIDLDNRDETVDWLVATGAVTADIYRQALEFQQLRSET